MPVHDGIQFKDEEFVTGHRICGYKDRELVGVVATVGQG